MEDIGQKHITSIEGASAFMDLRPLPVLPNHERCKRCKGHGRWNLVLNFRGPGQHQQQGCMECHGVGSVPRNR